MIKISNGIQMFFFSLDANTYIHRLYENGYICYYLYGYLTRVMNIAVIAVSWDTRNNAMKHTGLMLTPEPALSLWHGLVIMYTYM